ncbi:MAG: phosphate acyltransferase PlsX [Clostridiales bacterium]|nr:phosphate acyltransferase PlsX [Clostridiales bacterium]
MIRVFLDALGGDNAPEATCRGAIEAIGNDPELHITLAGPVDVIAPYLDEAGDLRDRLSIVDAPEVIDNSESPALAIRQKKKSAVVMGMLALRAKETDAFVSAGATGAVLVGGMLRLGRIPGIERPALAPLIPSSKGQFLLIDCGANVDSRPEWLAQFGIMGDAYMKRVMGIEKPRIGLVNNGAEEEKGNQLYSQAHQLLKKAPVHFVGNIEGRYIPADHADVIVCDGFDGNLILKYTEGIAMTLMGMIKRELMGDTRSKLGALLSKNAFQRVKKRMDYTEVGGAPLLGVQGAVVKAHGSSNARAISSAIRQAASMVRGGVAQAIEEAITVQTNTDNIQ